MPGVGSSPARVICKSSQVLLAGVPGLFVFVLPFLSHLLIGPSHMSYRTLTFGVYKQNK